jgi:hypothetical protein
MDFLPVTVLEVISGPTKRTTQIATKSWLEGEDQPPQTTESSHETWEIVALVEKPLIGPQRETFKGLTKEGADKIIPGYVIHF